MGAVLTKRNEALEEDKKEMEAKVSRANTKIERILKEKMALKEKGEEMSMERDEVIQVLRREIETLEAPKKEHKMHKNRLLLKREEDEELYNQAHGSEVVGILGSAAAENQGRIPNETSKKMGNRRILAIKEEVDEEMDVVPPKQSWYESKKRRDWNTFVQYLRNREPMLTLGSCSGAHAVEFLKYLDQFGTTKVHVTSCSYVGQPDPLCPFPLHQAWVDLVGILIAVFKENSNSNGGRSDYNPFASNSIRDYVQELRRAQTKSRTSCSLNQH